MPTRKQRRREAKLRRHEWEEVYLDAEGHEIPPEEVEDDGSHAAAADRGPGRAAKNGKPARDVRGRPLRRVQPPSWQRVFRRAAIFGPIMFAVLVLANQNGSAASQVGVAAVYTALLIPFMYLMDRLAYRTYLRRTAGRQVSEPRRPRR